MSESTSHTEHRELSPSATQVQIVHDRSGFWVGIIALILGTAGAVLGWHAEREASIATMRVEGMTRALIAHGITDTYPHVPGEDD